MERKEYRRHARELNPGQITGTRIAMHVAAVTLS